MAVESIFVQIAAVQGLAALAGVLAQWLRQPLIIAKVLGIFLGDVDAGKTRFGWREGREC